MTESELMEGCIALDPRAQKKLYDRYAPKMLGVCRRYIGAKEDAEDALSEGFFKVFTHINQFNRAGSFEGWIRRIMVNESLMFLRKKGNLKIEAAPEWETLDHSVPVSVEHELAAADILKLLEKLPVGYRTVFNLYVIEGYKHIEIAELLNISIHTSKSQLVQAKERLRRLLTEQ